ncbi:MAG: cytochrome b N-terminal domain-containing protein [Nitrospirae bacterium]|nr:cytochrome b N-terminal domain-containing protein [Nitrospirota bacterium]
MLDIVYKWIDERINLQGLQNKMLNEPIPGGARYAYVFGSALLFIFAMQIVTGILMMFYYAPTVDHAWQSIRYIMEDVDHGWLIRGIHHWGSSAMVVTLVVHATQVFLWGAYKKPREMVWIVGLLLAQVVIGLGFTGYLLPWDQKAYWGSVVGIEVAGVVPVIGDFLARFLKGGTSAGVLTLNRFFVIHVMILPLSLMGLAGLHLFLFRKAGPAGPFKGEPAELERTKEFFFPKQVYKDSVFMLMVFAVLVGLAYFSPPELMSKANPAASAFDPEPEWYFLSIFQLLRLPIFAGQWGEFVGAIVVPGLFFGLLFALPFLDARKERNPLKRPIATGGMVAFFAATLILMGLALSTRETLFHHDEKLSAVGMEIYYTKGNCAACHAIAGLDEDIRGAPGGAVGPALTDEADVDKRQVGGFLEWQIVHLKDPAKLSPGSIMPPAAAVGLTETEMVALAHFLGDHTKGLPAKAMEAFKKKLQTSAPAAKP